MQYDPPNLREPHERTLTDRSRAYQMEVRALRKQEVKTNCVNMLEDLLIARLSPGYQRIRK